MPDNIMMTATPESVGIPSQAILDFLHEMRELRFPLHSYLLMRHGKVVAEGYCPPFDAERKHRMYSVSKSFTSVAVGMMIDEGKLSLDDKVADFFPEYIPENDATPYIREATVRDLLTMATFNESTTYTWESPDFVRAFFDNVSEKHMPGTIFHYDTAGTVTLCGIVEKLSGKPMLEYMRPLLDELGISKDVWCIQTPEGRSWTGSGILCTPRDLARFGQFCLQRGLWNGKQLVSREYMEAATSYQIDTSVSHNAINHPPQYGYQFWMLKDGGFACCGMGSQFAFMMPKYDTVMITTADTQGVSNADDVIRDAHYRLLEKSVDCPLPENPGKQAELAAWQLTLPLPYGIKTTPLAPQFSGVKYAFEDNLFGFKWMRLDVAEDACTLTYEKPSGVHSLTLPMGAYQPITFPEPYFGRRIGVKDTHYRCVSAAAWERDNTLIGTIYAVDDYVGTLRMQLTFKGDTLTVFMTKFAEAFFDDYRGYLSGHAVKG